MRSLKKIFGILIIAGLTAAGSGAANAFWGPFDWWDDGPGWGYPGYGYPGYGWGGYPGYGYGGYPGYGWGGYPGYGYGGYPGYGWGGYPGYGYAPPAAPAPAEKADK
ncbi:MAG TPA: hypothetical protein VLB10_04390 [Gammaproteobacteria bacterium]|jgi:hypothetical protein|nr:hypothetical protein [Gammaproteobacteria bacterium]